MACQLEARLRAKATIAASDLAYAAHRLSGDPSSLKRKMRVDRAKEGKATVTTLMEIHMSECETCMNAETAAA